MVGRRHPSKVALLCTGLDDGLGSATAFGLGLDRRDDFDRGRRGQLDRRDDLHWRSDGHRQDRRSLQVGDGALAFDVTMDSGRTHSAKPV